MVLSYPAVNFPVATDHPLAEHPDLFWATVVLDQTNVGSWKRTVRADVVEVDIRLAPSVDVRGRQAVRAAALRLAEFLEKGLELTGI